MKRNTYLFAGLLIVLVMVLLAAASAGAVRLSVSDMLLAIQCFFSGDPPAGLNQGIFLHIRLPRVLLAAITGAVLAASGVLMQGLFRNPIIEPGLAGTSAGAAFGASIVFVLAAGMSASMKSLAGPLLVPVFAFAGALLATFAVYWLARSRKKVDLTSLLLTGIAVNAVGLSGTGFMSYIARDPQARSITFWNLGTFSGAAWDQVGITAALSAIVLLHVMRYARQLNALMLGEEEALYLGIDPEKLKRRIMIINTAMVALVTAFAGVIGFMGLIVPHIMRLLTGSDHKVLLPTAMVAGAVLMTVADMGARLLLAPAEIPVGIITSLTGAPIYIYLLKKQTIRIG